MSTERFIQIRAKVPVNSDGTVFKEFNANEKFRRQDVSVMLKLLPLIQKYDLDFLPKIIDYNEKGYTYQFVDGTTLKEELDNGVLRLTQKMIYEMKIAMDNISKVFYEISIENKDDELFNNGFLYHGDPWIGNAIWNDDTKKFIFIDIDSLSIAEFIPLTQLNNMFFQHLETVFITQDKDKSTLGTFI